MSIANSLPPDRSHIRTEHRHPDSLNLDQLSTEQFIALMVEDHRCVLEAVRSAAPALALFIDALVLRMRPPRNGRLMYLGAGTSGRLGVLDASECPPTFQSDPNQVIGIIAGGDSALRKSSEGKEDDVEGAREALEALKLTADDSVLGIAAGGTTPYVLGGLQIAKRINQQTLTGLLTCAARAKPDAGVCDHFICLSTGPEILTGSTRLKAGSATKLALNIISTGVFVQMGKAYSNLMIDLRATNAKLKDRAIRILMEVCPELTRESAAALLVRADGALKPAILMQRLDIDLEQATRMLAQHGGRLSELI